MHSGRAGAPQGTVQQAVALAQAPQQRADSEQLRQLDKRCGAAPVYARRV